MGKDPKTFKTLDELMKSVDNGEFVIPNFQRGYEWTPSMVTDLLVSVIQEYYTGLLLFWEPDPKVFREEKWDPLWGVEPAINPTLAILDGQQRLASLYYAIYGPLRKFPTRDSFYVFFLDLKKYLEGNFEEAIFYRFFANYIKLKNLRERKEEWIASGVLPLRILSDRKYVDSKEFSEWLRDYTKKLMKNPADTIEYDKIRDEIRDAVYKILNSEFVTHTLGKERELPDICSIFAKINQKGMKLSTFDLINAFLYPKQISLRKIWESLDNEPLKNVDSNMNEYLLKLMSLYKQEYCSSKYLFYLIPGYKAKKKNENGQVSELVLIERGDQFLELWNDACKYASKAIEKIMNVGKNDFGAIKYDFIPNTTIIPVMGALLLAYERQYQATISEKEFNDILFRWYWSAVVSGDYSGSSDSVMSEDFRDIKSWFSKKDISVIRRINKVTTDSVDGLDLKRSEKGSTLYNCLLCLIALNNAEDFYTTRILDTGTYTESRIHDHHIFPKKGQGYSPEKTKKFSQTQDSVLNRTLLLDATNEDIKAKRPSQYLKEVLSKLNGDTGKLRTLMERHLISEAALDCMWKDNYDEFIEEIEKTMKQRLTRLLQ